MNPISIFPINKTVCPTCGGTFQGLDPECLNIWHSSKITTEDENNSLTPERLHTEILSLAEMLQKCSTLCGTLAELVLLIPKDNSVA